MACLLAWADGLADFFAWVGWADALADLVGVAFAPTDVVGVGVGADAGGWGGTLCEVEG